MKRIIINLLLIVSTLGLGACTGIPQGVTPVSEFEVERYLGKWYEIARLDHSFERGLDNVTATYSKRDDGGIRVINRGYDRLAGEWSEAEGKAFPIGEPGIGRLKVSFFGPFYGGYNIVMLDGQEYRYSMVSGPDRSYLWILSRTPELEPSILKMLVDKAGELGFDTEALIYVDHTPVTAGDGNQGL
jgi:apolipoprotein D and lipocalin family protein